MNGEFRQDLRDKFFRHGFEVAEAQNTADALSTYHSVKPDVVIIYSSNEISENGLKKAKELRHKERNLPIIFITKFSSEASAIAALQAGVNDYFKLPLSGDEVVGSIKKLLSELTFNILSDDQESGKCSIHQQPLIGETDQMREIQAFIRKVAQADSTVLITGETGTGKEIAAQLIHCGSVRKEGPFVSINCAALPENLVESELFGFDRGAFTGAIVTKKGKFELAKGGTIFMDEIGDMNLYSQAKILRSIESKKFYHLGGKGEIPVNARIVTATNQDPERLVAEGSLRQDLYYRLNVARIHMPPLRERKEDIPSLTAYAIRKLNHQFNRDVEGLTEEAMTCLFRYDWPGNVRELLNILEATYINLPPRPSVFINLPKQIQTQLKAVGSGSMEERKRVVSALLETKWNKSTAAQKLNWSRMTLYRKILKHNIVENRNPER